MNTHSAEPTAEPESKQPALFDLPPAAPPPPEPNAPSAPPRLRQANRAQVEWRSVHWDGLLPEDHRARVVWQYVEGLDLAPLYRPLPAVEGEGGSPPSDPHNPLSLS